MKWLQDTWNGLVVILIKPHLPRFTVILALIVGTLVGLFWGYAVAPTVYFDADPSTLEQSWQNEWVKLLADRYALTTDRDISANIVDLLSRIDDPLGVVDNLLASGAEVENVSKLQALRPLAEVAQNTAATAPQPNNTFANISPFLIAPIALVIAATIFIVLYSLLIKPIVIDPLIRRLRGEKTSKEVIQARKTQQDEQRLLQTQKTDFQATSNLGPPLMQRMTTYRTGTGDYDESYEIEENDMFLGQCGAVISDAIGSGDGQAMAIEVWLFDKDDFVRTMTKVFASDYAFNDPASRTQLQEKGDLVLAQPGAVLTLETNSLRLQARIVEMEYGVGALPPNSFFQKLTIELAGWRKIPGSAPVQTITQPIVAAPAPIPTYTQAPVFNPTTSQPIPPQPSTLPAMPSTLPPMTPAQPQRPPQAPPVRSLPPDDDPFGGTGDFTPIG